MFIKSPHKTHITKLNTHRMHRFDVRIYNNKLNNYYGSYQDTIEFVIRSYYERRAESIQEGSRFLCIDSQPRSYIRIQPNVFIKCVVQHLLNTYVANESEQKNMNKFYIEFEAAVKELIRMFGFQTFEAYTQENNVLSLVYDFDYIFFHGMKEKPPINFRIIAEFLFSIGGFNYVEEHLTPEMKTKFINNIFTASNKVANIMHNNVFLLNNDRDNRSAGEHFPTNILEEYLRHSTKPTNFSKMKLDWNEVCFPSLKDDDYAF